MKTIEVGSRIKFKAGEGPGWAKGREFQIVRVWDGEGWTDEGTVTLGTDDVLEVAPWMPEEGRFSFATTDAEPEEVEAV